MPDLVGPINSGDTTGGAGVSTANKTTNHALTGKVTAVYVKYNGSPPATTDVTIATEGASGRPPANTVLTLTNKTADGWFYPYAQIHDELGVGVTYDGTNQVYEPVPIADFVTVTIAQANDGDSIDVWLILGKY